MPVFAFHRATCQSFVSTHKPEASYMRSKGSKEISCYKIRRKPQAEHLNVSGQKVEENLTACQEKCLPTRQFKIDSIFLDISDDDDMQPLSGLLNLAA
jgi:hypothetical protein